MTHVDTLSCTHGTRDDNIRNIRTKLETGIRLAASGRKQLYLPSELEEYVMRSIHKKYGHVGIEKCVDRIQRSY